MEDGTVIIHDDWVTNPNGSSAWNTSITKVEDNKAYVGDTLYGNIQTEKIKNGGNMFYGCSALTAFSSDLSSLELGYQMFYNSSNFTTFDTDLSSLTNGRSMFYGCFNLATFTSDLSSLELGYGMFSNCSKLTTFDKDMRNLENGDTMFSACSKLSSFTSDLSNLRTCNNMFWGAKLKSFSIDLKSLVNGGSMFARNSTLTTFVSDLSSLVCGNSMFYTTKLSSKSVMYIINTIKDLAAEKKLYQDGVIPYVTYENYKYSAPSGFTEDGKYVYSYKTNNGGGNPYITTTSLSTSSVGKLTIGIGVTNNSSTIDQQLQDFAEGTLFDSWADLKQAFVDKGWDVTWQYGGSETSITYDLRDGERIIPCPIYAQLIEEEDKERAEYCSEDGTKFYNIEWGHDVTHPEEFQQFDSLETACVSYGVMPKEYLETNGQTTLF